MSDMISRQDAIEQIQAWAVDLNHPNRLIRDDAVYILEALPSADRPKVDCTDFIKWLRDEVLNEELWELNAVGYGEIIARKLTKLGAMECEDGFYYSADRPKVECYVDQPMVVRGVSDRYLLDKMNGVIVYGENLCRKFVDEDVLGGKRYIDRAELFNRLAEIKAPPEANEYKAAVYSLIQSM